MSLQDTRYFGTYCRLDETSGDSGIIVDGNSWPIGSELELTPQLHVTARGKEVPRVVLGKGDKAAGFVPEGAFKQLKKCLDADWTCRAIVSLVVYDKLAEKHWVEAALFCYPEELSESMGVFVSNMAARIAKGEHPVVSLSEKELSYVLDSKGAWVQTKPQPLPELAKGSAYYKTKQTLTERLAWQAASGNKGCVVAIVAVVVVVVALVVFAFFR